VDLNDLRASPERSALTSLPSWEALLRHLSLASGADVLFLITPDASGAKACRRELQKSRLVRNLAADVPNDPASLYDVLEAASQVKQPVISWIELPEDVLHEALPYARAAWDQAFAALNPHRNVLLQEITAPIIFAGPPWMFQSFRSHAPDWFSVRAGVFDLTRDIEKSFMPDMATYSGEGRQPELLPEEEIPSPEFPPHATLPDAVILEKTIEQLPLAEIALLQTLGWLDPSHPIPVWLLASHPALPEDESASDALDSLVWRELLSRSFDGLWLRLHPTVSASVSRSLPDNAARHTSLENALEMLDNADLGDPQNPTTWSRWLPAAPHVRRLIEGAESLDFWDPAVRWCNRLGRFYLTRADYTAAELLLRKAHTFAISKLDPENIHITTTLNNLAQVLQATNRLSEAEPLMREVLRIDHAAYGEDHPNVAIRLNNLATLLQATNRLSEAEPLMREALRIDRAAYGEDHSRVASDLNNLAQLLQATNHLSEAEPLMREALRIDRSAYGEDHPNVAIRLNNLATLLQATNRLSEAEPLMREALRIDRTTYGEDHPRVATDLNNLAQLLQDTNRLSDAEPLMREALRIDLAAYGEDHPDVAIDFNNLARLLQATNRLSEAEPLMREALRIDRAAYGEDHPDVAIDFNNLARLLQDTNRMPEAEPLMRGALRIFHASLGSEHPNTKISAENLDLLLAEMAEAAPEE